MSGHNKWSTIKHKKGKEDAKRGKLFTKLIKEITTAARNGGDPGGNPRLRLAIDKAKDANLPADNITRAIKKGTGELEGVQYDEITYEGYGPHGVAVLVETLTDNKNRTVAEVRHLFNKHNGNLGETGCVSYLFKQKGMLTIASEGVDADELFMLALDAGAEDIEEKDGEFEISTEPVDLESVKKALMEEGYKIQFADLTRIPDTEVTLTGKPAHRILKFVDLLEDNDDVQNVYANFDIADSIIEEYQG